MARALFEPPVDRCLVAATDLAFPTWQSKFLGRLARWPHRGRGRSDLGMADGPGASPSVAPDWFLRRAGPSLETMVGSAPGHPALQASSPRGLHPDRCGNEYGHLFQSVRCP